MSILAVRCQKKTGECHTYETAHLRPVLVEGKELVRKFGQLEFALSDVEDIRINVNVIDPMWIECPDLLKLGLSLSEVYRWIALTSTMMQWPRYLPWRW